MSERMQTNLSTSKSLKPLGSLRSTRCAKIFLAVMMFYVVLGVVLYIIKVSSWSYIPQYGPKFVPTRGQLWPKAQIENISTYYYTFRPPLHVNINNHNCNIIKSAVLRYNAVLEHLYTIAKKQRPFYGKQRTTYGPEDLGLVEQLNINLTAPCEEYPHMEMAEQYDLSIGATSNLTSSSVWGVLRGLESWSQLFYLSEHYTEVHINVSTISDYPQYKYRGLLLDTGRHYLSLKTILNTLDAMEINKMNVFHWHMVDDQSFPYQSEAFPDLSRSGAFHPSMTYTKADIKTVINYARDRGIRVVPEIDVPGHTRSWGEGYPFLLTKCTNDNKEYLGPMNPIQNSTYKMLDGLFKELQELFPDNYFHMGGDEVDPNCWNSNPETLAYMKEHGMTASQLQAMFMRKTINLLSNETVPVVWQEVFDTGVPISKNTLIQVWKYKWISEMQNILKTGHKLIFSSSWYLDLLEFNWEAMYVVDPRQMVYSAYHDEAFLDNIVGGEACMWGEMVDETNVISRTWPRASAVAERLWSGIDYKVKEIIATDDTHKRLEEHTCRMKRRDVSAQPPSGPGFCLL